MNDRKNKKENRNKKERKNTGRKKSKYMKEWKNKQRKERQIKGEEGEGRKKLVKEKECWDSGLCAPGGSLFLAVVPEASDFKYPGQNVRENFSYLASGAAVTNPSLACQKWFSKIYGVILTKASSCLILKIISMQQ